MTHWYLIVADRLGMATAEASLIALGHEVYYPREKISITRLNRRVKVERALLYKYIFVGAAPGSSLYDIRQAKGVFRLLEDIDGNPARISKQTVERFRRNEAYGIYDYTRRGKARGRLKPGTRVVVVEGPWTHWRGVIRSCGPAKAAVDIAGEISNMVIRLPVWHLAPA